MGTWRKTGASNFGLYLLVQVLVPYPAKPSQQAVKLLGLPGSSPNAGETRLWLDAELTSYVDIPDDAILYAKELPDDAGTIVWVAVDANLSYGSVSSHTAQAGFLGGAIASAHLAGAAAGHGPRGPRRPHPRPIRPEDVHAAGSVPEPACLSVRGAGDRAALPTLFGRALSLPFSRTRAPSQCFACQTEPPICPPFSQIWVCQPTQVGPCPSQAPCPSQTGPCPSVHNVCPPTHIGPCPSVHTLCPTPSALLQCPTAATCPSVHVLCPTPSALLECPTRLCPSVAVPVSQPPASDNVLSTAELACGGPGA